MVCRPLLHIVVLQKYNTSRAPGCRSQELAPGLYLPAQAYNDGGNPPFFNKHAFYFSSGKSDTDNPLKNRLKWDKVPYSKKFLKNGKHF